MHLGAASPHIDIGPASGNRGKVGFDSNNVFIGSTSGTGEIHFKNNIGSTDAPHSSGDTKMVIADAGVGIGTSSPTTYLDVRAPSGVAGPNVAYFKSDQHGLGVYVNIGSTFSEIRSNNNSYPLVLNASSGGNVGIGTQSPTAKLDVRGTVNGEQAVFTGGTNASRGLSILTAASGGQQDAGVIFNAQDTENGAAPFHAFQTAGTERMRISSVGRQTYNGSGTANGHGNFVGEVGSSSKALMFEHTVGGGETGSITTGSSSTAFNTSSDYRLKENVDYTWDATTRLKQLKPARFNFIADEDTTVDGFIAHEVQDIVPEAISGEKDAVDSEGNPEYQGIDQSKLVPLLTKAIQEQQTQIEELKKEVQELKSNG